jgi:hypothetical protein
LRETGRLAADHLAPDLAACAWLWRAFQELSTCRLAFGDGPGPIPITAIWAYLDRYGLPEWTVDALISIDLAWRETHRDRLERARPRPQPNGARGNGE